MKKRIAVVLVALVLSFSCIIGTTLAWLIDKTDSVVNTFTYGDINIELEETGATDEDGNEIFEKEYKMIPGTKLSKDPKVTVLADSEACWLFVKVEKSANFGTFMTYEIAAGWTPLDGEDGVYYREVAASNINQDFPVLEGNEVTVKDEVTKTQLNNLTSATLPTLKFTAYAIQKASFDTAADAWAEASK